MTPKVSVIIPAYNSAKYIQESVESALKQTLEKELYEVVVVDDGSTDNSREVLRNYEKEIILIENVHVGLAEACNIAIRKAQGDFIIRLDSDDYFEKSILELELSLMESSSEIAFVYCDRHEFGEGIERTVSLKTFNLFKMTACGYMFRKDRAFQAGLYRDLLFEEYDFYMRYLKGMRSAYIPKPLYYYRIHPSSITQQLNYKKSGIKELEKLWSTEDLAFWDFNVFKEK